MQPIKTKNKRQPEQAIARSVSVLREEPWLKTEPQLIRFDTVLLAAWSLARSKNTILAEPGRVEELTAHRDHANVCKLLVLKSSKVINTITETKKLQPLDPQITCGPPYLWPVLHPGSLLGNPRALEA